MKCGKAFILNKLLSRSENKNNLVENRTSTIKIKYTQKAVFIDTKGFNTPDKPAINNSQSISNNEKIENFLLNYIKDQFSIIIYILNAPTKYDFQIIEKLKKNLLRKGNNKFITFFMLTLFKKLMNISIKLKMYFLNLEKEELIKEEL